MSEGKAYRTVRPSSFTEPVRARYLDLLKLGYGRIVAAETVGVHPETVRRWYRGNPEFLEAMGEAEQNVVDRAYKQLVDMMDAGEFAAVKMVLERLDRNRFADNAHTLKVEVEGTISHEMIAGKSVDDAVEAIEAEIETRRLALEANSIEAEEIQ